MSDFASVTADQDLPAALPLGSMPPEEPAPPPGTPVSLLFSSAQADDNAVSIPFGQTPLPQAGRPTKASEDDEPFNLWLNRVWKEEPGYECHVERKSPAKVPVNGVPVQCAGNLGAIYDSPSMELIQQLHGGGVFDVRIMAPSESVAGQYRLVGHKELKLPGMPLPPNGINGNGGPNQNQMYAGRPQVAESAGVVNTAFATVHKIADNQIARGDALQEKAATERVEAQKVLANYTDRAIDSAEKLAEARANAAALQKENEHLGSRLAVLEAKLAQPQGPIMDPLAIVDRMAGYMRQPTPAENGGGNGSAVVVESLRQQLVDKAAQHRNEMDAIHTQYSTQIRALSDAHRDAMTAVKDDHRAKMEDLRSAHKDDIERARDHEKNAARTEVTAKQFELTAVNNELIRTRDDLREVKAKLATVEETLATTRASLAEAKAELAHRPKEPTSPLDQLAIVEKYKNAFGGGDDDDGGGRRGRRSKDDEPAEPWPMKLFGSFMESPMGQQVATMVVGGLTGENDKARRFEIARQQLQTQATRAAAARDATVAQARAAVATGGRVPVPTPQPAVATPHAQAAPGAPAQVINGMEPGDPPFPPPGPADRPLGAEIVLYKPLLSQAEVCVRSNISPAVFLDHVCKDFQSRGIMKPATMLRDEIVAKHKSHTLFWHSLKDGGAAEVFTGLDHPAGQRWLRALWVLVPEAAQIEG